MNFLIQTALKSLSRIEILDLNRRIMFLKYEKLMTSTENSHWLKQSRWFQSGSRGEKHQNRQSTNVVLWLRSAEQRGSLCWFVMIYQLVRFALQSRKSCQYLPVLTGYGNQHDYLWMLVRQYCFTLPLSLVRLSRMFRITRARPVSQFFHSNIWGG